MAIRAIGLLLCGGLLILAGTTGTSFADYAKGQGPSGAKGNHCHCSNTSNGMDCICGVAAKGTQPKQPKQRAPVGSSNGLRPITPSTGPTNPGDPRPTQKP